METFTFYLNDNPPSITLPSQDQCSTPPSHMEPSSSKKVFFHAPPLYLSSGYDFNTLKKSLFDLVNPLSIIFKNTPKHLIIRTDGAVNYNAVQAYLVANEEIKYHTYLPKPLKHYVVFIRHLHPSTTVEDIQASLIELGHEVIQVYNIKHHSSKCPLPLFRVDLRVAENNCDIFKLDLLLHTRIKIELPKKKRSPPQCHECQAFYQTSNFCHQSPRCVKCGDNHHTSECTKLPSEPAKCELCLGPHTASYRGCPVFKKLKENRSKSLLHKSIRHPVLNQNIPFKFTSTYKSPDVVCEDHARQPQTKSYAEAVKIENAPFEAISTILAQFISNFNSLISPLISLLTEVVHKRFSP
ncbi:hypothetical protein QTP88_005328 [Uroleucon formosanum]